jgi:phosphomannomutase
MKKTLTAFRLGDVRGIYPDEVNEDFALGFGHALAQQFDLTGIIAVGRDMRDSSPSLQARLIEGLLDSGLDVVDLGMCASEIGYFASTMTQINAAVIVTASHNPPEYNGFKVVLNNGQAVTFFDGLVSVMQLMLTGHRNRCRRGSLVSIDVHQAYLAFLHQQFKGIELASGLMALNGLNGMAATLAVDVAEMFNLPTHWFRQQPGPIPAEGADPSKPRLKAEMRDFMQTHAFTMGVAWDGDCDRCMIFDTRGELIPTYYIIGLLAEHFLRQQPGAAVTFDTKLCWNTIDIIRRLKGQAIRSETGHAFMKRHMSTNKAVYGGELSSHHYFGHFFGCDSGMIAWLEIIHALNIANTNLTDIIDESKSRICSTPEINLRLSDITGAFESISNRYGSRATHTDYFDGPSFEMPGDWRFTLRRSKTEPLVRLNLEARGNPDRLLNEGSDLLSALAPFQADDSNWHDSLIIQ